MGLYEDNSISHDITTDAGFRAWAQKIHDGLSSVGLVVTSDTGQIDLTTVATPGSNNTYAGYEIWRFNDSDQSAEPIYIKVEYGRGGAAPRPSLRLSAGRGSNGSGTLTTASSTVTLAPSSTPSGNGRIHIAHANGAVVIYSNCLTTATGTTSIQVFSVERLRDASGTLLAGTAILVGFTGGTFTPMTFYTGAWSTAAAELIGDLGGTTYSGTLIFGGFRVRGVSSGYLSGLKMAKQNEIGAADSGLIGSLTCKRPNASGTMSVTDMNGNLTTVDPVLLAQ